MPVGLGASDQDPGWSWKEGEHELSPLPPPHPPGKAENCSKVAHLAFLPKYTVPGLKLTLRAGAEWTSQSVLTVGGQGSDPGS